MVRDWDTIRAILLKLEACEQANAYLAAGDVEGIPEQEVAYHMMILNEGHLIDARVLKSSAGDGRIAHAQALRLTWEGHELLDKIRSDTLWNKIKSTVKDKGLDLTFDTIKAAAAALIKAMF
jgi:hypothetical protein